MKIVTGEKLVNDIKNLPENLSRDLEDYINYLIGLDNAVKYPSSGEKRDVAILASPKTLKERGYGSLKGKIWMSDNFDEPLAEFEDYM
jgi:hypothetical protein